MANEPIHILSLSGGKDSAALAVYLNDRDRWRAYFGFFGLLPAEKVDLQYLFMDTGKELPETYDYLFKLEAYLGKPLIRIKAEQDFDFYLKGNYFSMLPSPQMRWCTRLMKLRPFEQYCGERDVVSYVGIRADEDREGYISHKPNIRARFPFKEDGIVRKDVFQILEETGLGLPAYYDKIPIRANGKEVEVGRSRSGCTFCFYQQKIEWVWLLEKHPEAYQEAMDIEEAKENGYTWVQGETLAQLKARKDSIIEEHLVQKEREKAARKPNSKLIDLFGETEEEEWEERGCAICHL